MRLWNLSFAVLVAAVMLAIARDDAGRVALIVFVTGVGLCGVILTALMTLFGTIAAIAQARGPVEGLRALAATAAVLAVGSALTLGTMFVGAQLVAWAVP